MHKKEDGKEGQPKIFKIFQKKRKRHWKETELQKTKRTMMMKRKKKPEIFFKNG